MNVRITATSIQLITDNTSWMFSDELHELHTYEAFSPTVEHVINEVADYFQLHVIHLFNDKNLVNDPYFIVFVRILHDRILYGATDIAELLHLDVTSVVHLLDRSDELFVNDSLLASQYIHLYLKLGCKPITS